MDHVKSLRCLICGRTYAPDEVEYVCPHHGNEGILDVEYDYELIARRLNPDRLARDSDPTIWRYRPLLPVRPDSPVPPLTVGGTPIRADRLAEALGLRHVWVKDDGRLPTVVQGSGRRHRRRPGTGRQRRSSPPPAPAIAAAALAGLCANVGQRNVIFVPQSAPPA